MSVFDPSSLPQFSVIRCPFELDGDRTKKRFVVISHQREHVYCLKATSKVERYFADQRLLDGVLSYEGGECASFEQRTVIQPDNQFAISYDELRGNHARRELEIIGTLPAGAKERLIEAIRKSFTMEPNKKERLMAVIV